MPQKGRGGRQSSRRNSQSRRTSLPNKPRNEIEDPIYSRRQTSLASIERSQSIGESLVLQPMLLKQVAGPMPTFSFSLNNNNNIDEFGPAKKSRFLEMFKVPNVPQELSLSVGQTILAMNNGPEFLNGQFLERIMTTNAGHLDLERSGTFRNYDPKTSPLAKPVKMIGGEPVYIPNGWVRYSVPANLDELSDWPIAYHGTNAKGVLSILVNGLKVPQKHKKHDGEFAPRVVHGQWGTHKASIYVSPSVEYCAHELYAPYCKSADGVNWMQFVFETRVKPGTVKKRPSTYTPDMWPTGLLIDANFPKQRAMEWLIEKNEHIVVTGVLVRMVGPTVPEEIFGPGTSRITRSANAKFRRLRITTYKKYRFLCKLY